MSHPSDHVLRPKENAPARKPEIPAALLNMQKKNLLLGKKVSKDLSRNYLKSLQPLP